MKVSVSWSGGKDSALMLQYLLEDRNIEVMGLHTALDMPSETVGLHGIRKSLVENQSAAIGLPVDFILLPQNTVFTDYQKQMVNYYRQCKSRGIEAIAFGDIFLEDLKRLRLKLTGKAGLTAIFPLWGRNTRDLLSFFIKKGFKAKICAADTQFFDREDLGKNLDEIFLQRLPGEVDPCGENGEYHSFVYNGPPFKRKVNFTPGRVEEKQYEFKVIGAQGEAITKAAKFLFLEFAPQKYGEQ